MTIQYKYDPHDSTAEFSEFRLFKEMFNTDFNEYLSGNQFVVETSNHGWRNRSGTFDKEYNSGEDFLLDVLGDSSNASIAVLFEEEFCRVTLYSHDNPDGAVFKLRKE